MEKFLFGIEHEIPLVKNKFLDYKNLSLDSLTKVIQKFPVYHNDYSQLRIGDLGIKVKRAYIEGLEVFDENGYLIKQFPKGIELRTKTYDNVEELTNQLYNDFQFIRVELKKFKISPTFISFNPYRDKVRINIKLHHYERKLRRFDRGRKTAPFTLLTFGPDINISCSDLNDNDVLEIVKKLNFYTPFIIPFSFSSPFYKGKLWGGQSIRCYLRLKLRPAVLGFITNKNLLEKFKKIWLLEEARITSEKGKIEFKAIDTIQDLKIYKGLLILLKGIILDSKLTGKSLVPDKKLIYLSSFYGFGNKLIKEGAEELIARAKESVNNPKEINYLDYLSSMIKLNRNLSLTLIKEFKKFNSIEKVLLKHTNFLK